MNVIVDGQRDRPLTTSAFVREEWVINWTKLHGGGPSSLYSWSISHILKHDFFCLGHFVSNTYPEKMLKLFMDGRYTITEVLLTSAKHFKITWVVHMCFERFLLAFESRDYLKPTKVLRERFLSQTEWWEVKVIFLSLRPKAWTFCKMYFVNPLRFTSYQKKLSQLFTFQACKLLSDKMTKTILPNYQIAFLGITVIYHSKIECWERRQSCNSLVSLR